MKPWQSPLDVKEREKRITVLQAALESLREQKANIDDSISGLERMIMWMREQQPDVPLGQSEARAEVVHEK